MLIALNDVAKRVLGHLPCSVTPRGGYFGAEDYCIAVQVKNVAEAFKLGQQMGAEAEGSLGEIGFDKQGAMLLVVFRSARVAQGPK